MKVITKYLVHQLLESVMVTSREFASIIYDMPDKISDIIFDIIEDNTDIKTNYNSIDINKEKNDEISFIPDSQYQRFLTKGDDITTKTKSNAKIGRMVGQILKDNGHSEFTPSDIEKFVNSFKAAWNKRMGIINRKTEVVKGKDILKWYNSTNYNSDKGTLGNSCMRYSKVNSFMKIYAENPEKISMVIITDEGKLVARSLFWILDETTQGSKKFYLDRIYVEKDSDVDFLYDWVVENLCDGNQNILSSYKNDDHNKCEMKVILNKTTFDSYPYADTFNYLYEKLSKTRYGFDLSGMGYVSNINIMDVYDGRKSEIVEQYMISEIRNHSGGTPTILSHVFSEKLDVYLKRKDAAYDSEVGWIPNSMCKRCNFTDRWIYEENAVWSEKMQDWISKDSVVNDPKFGIVHKEAIVDIATKYIGKYDNQIDLYSALERGDAVFKTEKVLKNDTDIEWDAPQYKGSGPRYYKNELLGKDYWGEWQIKLISYQVFNCGNYNSLILSTPGLSRFPQLINDREGGRGWMTQDDAALFGIEPDLQDSKWIGFPDYMISYSDINYVQFMRFLNKSNIDQSIKERIAKSKKCIHQYFLGNSSYYARQFEARNKLSSIDTQEVYLDLFNAVWKDLMINQQDVENSIKERFKDFGEVDENLIQSAFEVISGLVLVFIGYNDTNSCRARVNSWLRNPNAQIFKDKINSFGLDWPDFTEICRGILGKFIDNINRSKRKNIDQLLEKFDVDNESFRDIIQHEVDFNSINPFV